MTVQEFDEKMESLLVGVPINFHMSFITLARRSASAIFSTRTTKKASDFHTLCIDELRTIVSSLKDSILDYGVNQYHEGFGDAKD